MTFEEFFIKKKIDLQQLKTAEPFLFSEFKSHFELMGEKSFDHTKKFWFNKLRRTYPLKEVPKPEKETIEETGIASQADPLRSPTIDQKPAAGASSAPLYPDSESKQPAPAFKPRFKPRNFNVKEEEASAEESQTKEEAPQPVYKPRFKPKNIARTESPAEAEAGTKAEPVNPVQAGAESKPDEERKPVKKPGFRPRNIKPKEESGIDIPATAAEKTVEANAQPEEKQAENKPVYKPRFNPKNIPGKFPQPENKQESPEPEADKPVPDKPSGPEKQDKEIKTAYKPRFNMKNIKPKTGE